MRKVTCTQCGLVNLERFVTFPHCAGCGARLPEGATQQRGFWAQPLRAPFWATIVALGCAALAVGVVEMSRETARTEHGRMVVYPQLPRSVELSMEFPTQFQLDAADAAPPNEFREVRLRFSRAMLNAFEVTDVQPEPDSVFSTSGGRYFMWDQIEREQPVRVTLRGRKIGEHRFNAQMYARDFAPFECRNFVQVRPPKNRSSLKGKSHGQ